MEKRENWSPARFRAAVADYANLHNETISAVYAALSKELFLSPRAIQAYSERKSRGPNSEARIETLAHLLEVNSGAFFEEAEETISHQHSYSDFTKHQILLCRNFLQAYIESFDYSEAALTELNRKLDHHLLAVPPHIAKNISEIARSFESALAELQAALVNAGADNSELEASVFFSILLNIASKQESRLGLLDKELTPLLVS